MYFCMLANKHHVLCMDKRGLRSFDEPASQPCCLLTLKMICGIEKFQLRGFQIGMHVRSLQRKDESKSLHLKMKFVFFFFLEFARQPVVYAEVS